MHACYLDTEKFRETFHSYPSDTSRLQCADVNNPLQTVLYCVHLLKLYDKSIIISLKNDLTNIYSEISKIRLIL